MNCRRGKRHLTLENATPTPLEVAGTEVCGEKGYEVLIRLTFDRAQVAEAIAYARAKKWTHERDKDWGALLFDATTDAMAHPATVEVEHEGKL